MRLIAHVCSAVLAMVASFGYGDDPGRAWFVLAIAAVWALLAIAWSRP